MRTLKVEKQTFTLKEPFRITGYTMTDWDVVLVRIAENGHKGFGEASGIYYFDETAESMMAQIESVKHDLERGATRRELLELLPRGGARNAVDCALWDLESKLVNKSIWKLTGIPPKPVDSVLTVGIADKSSMVRQAMLIESDRIKVKLDDDQPLEKMRAIRAARPDVKLLVDVNQGWDFSMLCELSPEFAKLKIDMIEQPLKRGEDDALEGYESPVPLCADESCLDTSELDSMVGKYDIVNIKLDKTGGLTEALDLANQAHRRSLKLMVGNMGGTSLAMAPGFVVAQLCEFVDLDGALFLSEDREQSLEFNFGTVFGLPTGLWGNVG